MLRIVYKDYKSSFAELLSEDKSLTVHHRNVQKLAVGNLYQVLFTAEIEFLKILVPRQLQDTSNISIECARKSNHLHSLCD